MKTKWSLLLICLFALNLGFSQTENINIKELLTLTNQQRAKYGKKSTAKRKGAEPLVWNETLAQAAMVQATYLIKKSNLTHTGAKGSNVGTRVKNLGYQWVAVGENLAKGQISLEEVIKDWMQSPGHRKNILNPLFTEFGAALVATPKGELIWVQVFGSK